MTTYYKLPPRFAGFLLGQMFKRGILDKQNLSASGLTVLEIVEAWDKDTIEYSAIDVDHLQRQKEWSEKTFGPGNRTEGVIDHIKKELEEIRQDPTDIFEWVDILILAFDGAWRAGWEPQEIIDAIKSKQAINEKRQWPDWTTRTEDEAIEHVR